MQVRKTTTLTTVLSEVLANLAFMFTDDGEFVVPVGEEWLETEIGYKGPASGSLRLTCSRAFAGQLAANLLAVESADETTEEESSDAVKEFMNVVCGQYVTAAFGAEDVFNLTIPEVRELTIMPELGDPEDGSADAAVLSVGGQWIRLVHRPTA